MRGTFKGECADHASQSPTQTLEGFVRTVEDDKFLIFLKIPSKRSFYKTLYALQKKDPETAGTYGGRQYAIPQSFELMFRASGHDLHLVWNFLIYLCEFGRCPSNN